MATSVISGAAHSGYPIQDQPLESYLFDLARYLFHFIICISQLIYVCQISYPGEKRKRLGSGTAWGCFHEIGHNLQNSRWTPTGTGEVTNNIFGVFINNKVELHSSRVFYP